MKIALKTALFALAIMACKQTPKESSTQETSNDSLETENLVTTKELNDNYLKGIDIYYKDTKVDWNALKGEEISFVFIKATEGVTYLDPKFLTYWEGAQEHKIIRGAYHYYSYKDRADHQAQFFINSVLARSKPTDLPPTLDLEEIDITKITKTQYQKNVLEWLRMVKTAFGRTPIVYVSPSFANTYLDHPDFSQYTLWVANYRVSEPKVVDAWKNVGWTFWQYDEKIKINGIEGPVDPNYFKGTLEDLRSL